MNSIIIAESAGFCFGVNRSVKIAEDILKAEGKCKSFGELIHNDSAISMLKKEGLTVIESVSDVLPDDIVIIRAHGVSAEIENKLLETGADIIDATCPRVKAIHKIVSEASGSGRFVIIIGNPGHPEVEAVYSRCTNGVVIEDSYKLTEWLEKNCICDLPVTVVAQTTQTSENYKQCCEILKKICTNIVISDTICFATHTRQNEAKKMSEFCDAMVVIGGRHSANSINLANICSRKCKSVQFISFADELDLELLKCARVVGVTAGASTPAWIIKEVVNKMDEIKVEEMELSFDEMLENSLKPIYNGDKVSGIVVAITTTDVSVDLGTKYSGFIPASEFTDDGTKLEDAVKIGDTVEAVVVRVNDVEGTAQLSKKRLDAQKIWNVVEDAVDAKTVLEGTVVEENKGGVVVNVKGVRVFVPASQTDLPRDADLSQLRGSNVRLQITEVNKARKRIVGSIKRVAAEERKQRFESIWNEIEIGKKYNGVVKSMTNFGAFVDIGGIDGMIHVSELSWGRIRQPSEVLSVGDSVEVYVINFDKEKRKISLGYKDPDADPWKIFTNTYSVGDVASVAIVKLMDFGAFAEIIPGVDGLIHISQLADHRIDKAADVVSVGDKVDAKITAIDEEKHKVSLSVRALLEPAVEETAEAVEEE